jgi:superfamily II DNA/RNA helicase
MGFSRDINKIASYLTSSKRQTFLFSATFSDEIKQVAGTFLKKGYSVVDTVGEEVEQTHAHVPQSIVSVPTGLILFHLHPIPIFPTFFLFLLSGEWK